MFRQIWKSIRSNIIVGFMLVTPIVVTGLLLIWVFNFTTNRLIPDSLASSEYALLFRAASLLSVALLLFLIGLFVRNIIGRKLYKLGDAILTRIPFINRIYIYVRQISEAVVSQRQALFQDVVAVEYPRKGLYSIAFVTSDVPPDMERRFTPDEPADWITLFIPTTPNPTSGMLIFARRSDVVSLSMNVADAMKLVISGGVAYPGTEPSGYQPNLLDKLEHMLKGNTVKDTEEHEEQDA